MELKYPIDNKTNQDGKNRRVKFPVMILKLHRGKKPLYGNDEVYHASCYP